MGDVLSTALVVVSLAASALYLVRVWRHRDDPLRWGLFGVLLSTGLLQMRFVPWVHDGLKVAALASLCVVGWPIACDMVREVRALVRVAVDSWRIMVHTGSKKRR